MATQLKSESSAEQILEQVADLGNRLRAVEIDVAVIKANYARREDLANLEVRLIRWFVGTAITLTGVVATIAFAAAKLIH